jgi:hypothetical protein
LSPSARGCRIFRRGEEPCYDGGPSCSLSSLRAGPLLPSKEIVIDIVEGIAAGGFLVPVIVVVIPIVILFGTTLSSPGSAGCRFPEEVIVDIVQRITPRFIVLVVGHILTL